jgi:hypothetical protein
MRATRAARDEGTESNATAAAAERQQDAADQSRGDIRPRLTGRDRAGARRRASSRGNSRELVPSASSTISLA